MRMAMMVSAFALVTGVAWGAETAPAGAVVGWWRFNESPYKADSSGNGNAIDSFASGVGGVASGTDEWYICYHRRPIPNVSPNHRVDCLDRMYFESDGSIRPVVMTGGVE